jgi:hypothetical protein
MDYGHVSHDTERRATVNNRRRGHIVGRISQHSLYFHASRE